MLKPTGNVAMFSSAATVSHIVIMATLEIWFEWQILKICYFRQLLVFWLHIINILVKPTGIHPPILQRSSWIYCTFSIPPSLHMSAVHQPLVFPHLDLAMRSRPHSGSLPRICIPLVTRPRFSAQNNNVMKSWCLLVVYKDVALLLIRNYSRTSLRHFICRELKEKLETSTRRNPTKTRSSRCLQHKPRPWRPWTTKDHSRSR